MIIWNKQEDVLLTPALILILLLAEEEMKRRKKVEEQLIALQAEKQAALGAAAKENDGNSKRSHQLEVECAALRGELEALSISKDSAEDERKRRKVVEQQLLALQAEKQAAVAAAARMNSENKVRSNELESELTALRAEMLALGKNQVTSTGQGMFDIVVNYTVMPPDWLIITVYFI